MLNNSNAIQSMTSQVLTTLTALVVMLVASTVTANHLEVTVNGADIKIEGDFIGNSIDVLVRDRLRGQSVDIAYVGTISVRGSEYDVRDDTRRKVVTIDFDSIDDIRIYGNGGGDVITLRGFVAQGSNGDVLINAGSGYARVHVEDVEAEDIVIDAGALSNRITVKNSSADEWIAVRGGDDGDRITLKGCAADSMLIDGGDRKDIVVADSLYARQLFINAYGGNNTIELGHFVAANNSLPTFGVENVSINCGNDDDSIESHYISFSNMVINTRGGKDNIFMPVNDGDNLFINTGSDSDFVRVDSLVRETNSASSLVIETESGNDDVYLGSGAAPIDFELDWMEVDLGSGADHYANAVNGFVGNYVWNGGSGYDSHVMLPVVGTLYGDPFKTINFEIYGTWNVGDN